MEQLSGTDALFLYQERGNNYMHVAGLGIYDPSTAPDGKVRFRDILAFFKARLGFSSIFRRRLVTVPFSLDRPYWIEDPNVDVEFHVRHIALPYPGDWRQLCIQVARIHSRPLDRSKPLWELYVIEGLDNIPGLPKGSFAVMPKFHHCVLDGEAGAALTRTIHSLSPVDDHAQPTPETIYVEREPTGVELYSRALIHNAKRVVDFSKFYVKTAGRLTNLVVDQVTKRLAATAKAIKGDHPMLRRPPPTRFNRPVSAHRVFAAIDLPLDELKAIRQKAEGATLNDLFLTILGGAVRKYLADKKELPDAPLTAMVPVTLRGDDKSPGNQISMTTMVLHTDIEDPVRRLEAVCNDARKIKKTNDALGKDLLKNAVEQLPAFASDTVTRHFLKPMWSVTASNVRGPDVPLYLAGARLVHFYPVSIPFDYIGLNNTAFSYNGAFSIAAVACRDMMPDPGFYADCLRESYAELAKAFAEVQPAEAAPPAAKPSRRKTAAKVPSEGEAQTATEELPIAAMAEAPEAPPSVESMPETKVKPAAKRATKGAGKPAAKSGATKKPSTATSPSRRKKAASPATDAEPAASAQPDA